MRCRGESPDTAGCQLYAGHAGPCGRDAVPLVAHGRLRGHAYFESYIDLLERALHALDATGALRSALPAIPRDAIEESGATADMVMSLLERIDALRGPRCDHMWTEPDLDYRGQAASRGVTFQCARRHGHANGPHETGAGCERSREHAYVLDMGGEVPAIGVGIDEVVRTAVLRLLSRRPGSPVATIGLVERSVAQILQCPPEQVLCVVRDGFSDAVTIEFWYNGTRHRVEVAGEEIRAAQLRGPFADIDFASAERAIADRGRRP